MAGNAIGRGVVLDMSRYMNRVLTIDFDNKTTDVEPGVILADLSAAVERSTGSALTFAPDPSSKNRATVGGSIGNDACGNHSVRYGRTGDHVLSLDLVLADGARITATSTGLRATDPEDIDGVRRAGELSDSLKALVGEISGCLPLGARSHPPPSVWIPLGQPVAGERVQRGTGHRRQ